MDDYFMKIAINEAKRAFKTDNVPVGAIIVKNNKIIAKAYNTKNSKNISINHAEILSIIKASKKLKSWRLNDCTMYVTLEPCPMCMGAIVESRLSRLVYLVDSNYYDNFKSINSKIVKNKIVDKYGYGDILSDFFTKKRT